MLQNKRVENFIQPHYTSFCKTTIASLLNVSGKGIEKFKKTALLLLSGIERVAELLNRFLLAARIVELFSKNVLTLQASMRQTNCSEKVPLVKYESKNFPAAGTDNSFIER